MQLTVKRKYFTNESTIGELYIDGVFECFTLEDKDRELEDSMLLNEINEKKVFGKTAVPRGTYKVTVSTTGIIPDVGQRLINGTKQLPGIDPVKGYAGIRIHVGNKATHTEGCLLCGRSKDINSIGESRLALNNVFDKILVAWNKKEAISITYVKEVVTDTRQTDSVTKVNPIA